MISVEPFAKVHILEAAPFLSFGHPSPGRGQDKLDVSLFSLPPERGKGTEG